MAKRVTTGRFQHGNIADFTAWLNNPYEHDLVYMGGITGERIAGIQFDSRRCPLARYLRHINPGRDITVTTNAIVDWKTIDESRASYITKRWQSRFVYSIDTLREVGSLGEITIQQALKCLKLAM